MLRLITAREQVEMLSPWRTAMPVLYRGLEHEFDPAYDTNNSEVSSYSHWTDSPNLARQYAGPKGHVYQYDLPDEAMGTSYINDDGERPLYYDNEGKAGLHGVKGKEYLVYHDHEDYDPSKIKHVTAGAGHWDVHLFERDKARKKLKEKKSPAPKPPEDKKHKHFRDPAEEWYWPMVARVSAVDVSPFAYIRHVPWNGGGMYKVHDKATHEEIGRMGYLTDADGALYVDGIHTQDPYQHRGIATALVERMHADNPGTKINPGFRTDEGDALYQHLKETEPEFEDVAVPHQKDFGNLKFIPGRSSSEWGES